MKGLSYTVFQVLKQIRWYSDWSRKEEVFIFRFLYKDATVSEATNLTNGEYQEPWTLCEAVGCVEREINDRRSNAWVTGDIFSSSTSNQILYKVYNLQH